MGEWPLGYARHVFDSLDSTLSEAARMAPTLQGPTWIMAEEQTAARGRRGPSGHGGHDPCPYRRSAHRGEDH